MRFLLAFVFSAFSLMALGQVNLPVDPTSGEISYSKDLKVKVKCKKKIKKRLLAMTEARLDFPPMVFSLEKQSGDTLWIRSVTDVPSAKKLHPISFHSMYVVQKGELHFEAQNFKFEDINLSLGDWLEKYRNSDSERHQKNVELISKGIDSHIFLLLEEVKKRVENNK